MPKTIRREFSLKALDHALTEFSRKVRQNLAAKGLRRYEMEGRMIVEIAPDGMRRVLRNGAGKLR